ncbi:MAG: DUF952 domain-containing protein [Ferruginibacter sp.]|nr:DUF952 domain-containing protein [Ferruginibacter sp.]
MIYHITTKEEIDKSLISGSLSAPSLQTEGFIHTCEKEQIQGVIDRYYAGHTGLFLLHIDETKLSAMVKYELAPSVNEMFPHIFGVINKDAVVKVEEL